MNFIDNLYEYFSWFIRDLRDTLATPVHENNDSKENKNN